MPRTPSRSTLLLATVLLPVALAAPPAAAAPGELEQAYAKLVRTISSLEGSQRLGDDTGRVTLKDLAEVKRVVELMTATLAQLKREPAPQKLTPDPAGLERTLQALQKDLEAVLELGVEPGPLVRAQIGLDAGDHKGVVLGDMVYPALLSGVAVTLLVDEELVPKGADDSPQLRQLARACPMAAYEEATEPDAAGAADRRRYLAELKTFIARQRALSGASDLPATLTVLADPEERAADAKGAARPKPLPVPLRVVPVETWAAGFTPGTTETISGGGKRELTLADYLQKQYATTYASALHGNCAWVAQRLVLEPLSRKAEGVARRDGKRPAKEVRPAAPPRKAPPPAAQEETRRADREAAEREAFKTRCRKVYPQEIDALRSCARGLGCSLQDRMCQANCLGERSAPFRECFLQASTWQEK